MPVLYMKVWDSCPTSQSERQASDTTCQSLFLALLPQPGQQHACTNLGYLITAYADDVLP